MFRDYVSVESTPLYKSASGDAKVCYLLWGDGVKYDGGETTGTRQKVIARGCRGYVKRSHLGGQSLLEFYFIDVGQGDGILIKTPNFRHIMIDGGNRRADQDTGKNAADFVDWKFVNDYRRKTIKLDAMLASHCDADHYGGLDNLLDASKSDELDATKVTVESFYHAGLSWWKNGTSKTLGPHTEAAGDSFWTRLLDDRSSALAATGGGSGNKLHGRWKEFIEKVLAAKKENGQPTSIRRLSHVDSFLPGFEPNTDGEPEIRVLGPVEFTIGGKPAVRRFSGGNSQNTNGISLLLRVDYGRARVLLTGDLNKRSQHALLDDYAGERTEFQCDVAKACHHGSEDVSYRFLQAMNAGATVFSSGDNEGYDHPRASILAASATSGYLQVDDDDDDIVTPLIYSTELARSVDLGEPRRLDEKDTSGAVVDTLSGAPLQRSNLHIVKAKRHDIPMKDVKVVGGLVYGLVNVRTDGDRILCATRDEKGGSWRIKSFVSRF